MNTGTLNIFSKVLLDSVNNNFINSKYVSPYHSDVTFQLNITDSLYIQIRRWDFDKPVYLILFNKRNNIFELDMSRIIGVDNKFTWYLAQPRKGQNRAIYEALGLKWNSINDNNYLDCLRKQRKEINGGSDIPRNGYLVVQNADIDYLKESFVLLIEEVIKNYIVIEDRNKGENYSIEDTKALEGYKKDKLYLQTARNRNLVKNAKIRDNNTCQACGFKLFHNGNFIIECHHLIPFMDKGMRISNISDLICLCPTCHRIAHLRTPPYSLMEITNILKNNKQKF